MSLLLLFNQAAPPPPPVETGARGGDDAPARREDVLRLDRAERERAAERERRRRELRATLERAYRSATGEPETDIAAVVAAVEPFVAADTPVPAAEEVDWSALMASQAAVLRLEAALAAYIAAVEAEEDDIAVLLLM